MTLFFSENRGLLMMPDIFVMSGDERQNRTYHFCGVSLVENKYEPNDFNFAVYYAFGCNTGIGVTKEGVSLVQDGKTAAVVYGDFPEHALRYPRCYFRLSGKPQEEPLVGIPNCWAEIKHFLRKQIPSSQDAAQILAEITKWEFASVSTVNGVKTIVDERLPRNRSQYAEICVTGQQWFVHNGSSSSPLIMMGLGESVWGEIDPMALRTVSDTKMAPLPDGWAIRYYGHGHFLVVDKSSIKIWDVPIPYGSWHRYGKWTFWPDHGDVLLPNQQLVLSVVRRWYEIVGATPNWLFGVYESGFPNRLKDKTIIAIGLDGKEYLVASRDELGRITHFGAGEKHAFIVRESPGGCFLSVEDASGTQPLCQQWAKRLFADEKYEVAAMGVMAGSPDVAVILLRGYIPYGYYVFLVDANCRAALYPLPGNSFWLPTDKILMKQVDNGVDIERADTTLGEAGLIAMLRRVDSNCIRVFPEPNISMDVTVKDVSSESYLLEKWGSAREQ